MAKPAKIADECVIVTPKIASKEEADLVLQSIGRIEDKIRAIDIREREVIRQANVRAVTEAQPLIAQRTAFMKSLEKCESQ